MGARAGRRHDGPMFETYALRLRTWWHRDELDEQLEHGAEPAISAVTPLAYRAAQLRRRSTRNTLAAALEDAVREAHKTWSVSARLPLARAEVRACALTTSSRSPCACAPTSRSTCGGPRWWPAWSSTASSPSTATRRSRCAYVARSARLALRLFRVVRRS